MEQTRALHWNWDPAGPVGPNDDVAGAGGLKISKIVGRMESATEVGDKIKAGE